MTQAEVSCSAEPIKEEGDDTSRTMDLDWFLQVRSQYLNGPMSTAAR